MAPEGRPSGPLSGRTLRSFARGFLFGEISRPLSTPLSGNVATGVGVPEIIIGTLTHLSIAEQRMTMSNNDIHFLPVEGFPGIIPAANEKQMIQNDLNSIVRSIRASKFVALSFSFASFLFLL